VRAFVFCPAVIAELEHAVKPTGRLLIARLSCRPH
jgi:hypothetical protein